ncbi:glyoxalase [Roseateles aquatilis]|uniref:Glyoxalase n=1 Tax=Roseateles aquatilis TaxID=431061 RepID=A0A246JKR7_9BURK|nr:VOC family protein [Roseateles aquatilis]OWQ93244.1 glyoxalase [Roseateles aquatilis]
MEVFKTHGAFSWSELLTSDPAKAAEFYGKLFGWSVESMPGGPPGAPPYQVLKVGDTAVGGLTACPQQGMPPAWGVYVTVDNVDDTVAQARQMGAKVLMEIMEVPTVGRMATLQDPQGAVFNVITYVEMPDEKA